MKKDFSFFFFFCKFQNNDCLVWVFAHYYFKTITHMPNDRHWVHNLLDFWKFVPSMGAYPVKINTFFFPQCFPAYSCPSLRISLINFYIELRISFPGKKPILSIHHAASLRDSLYCKQVFPHWVAQIWLQSWQNYIVRSQPAPNSWSRLKPSAPHPYV